MKKEREQIETDRRGFLKLASVGAVGGAASAVAPAAVQAAEEKTREAGGYKETAHVRRYYDLARF